MIRKAIEQFKETKITEKLNSSLLNKIKEHQINLHNQLKQTSFRIVNKEVPKKTIDKLVEIYNSGKLYASNYKKIRKHYDMYVFTLTKSVLATIRIKNAYGLRIYLEKANLFYNKLKKVKPKSFNVAPIDIIDIREVKYNKISRYMLIEKVHPVVDVAIAYKILNFLYASRDNNYSKLNVHRYSKNFIRFLKSKNIKDYKDFFNKLSDAVEEYAKVFSGFHSYDEKIDVNEGNILLLDYDTKTNKFLFGPIDFTGAYTSSVD